MERIRGLHARGRAIEQAYLTNYAFADGEKLAAEGRTYQTALLAHPGDAPGALSPDDAATIAYIMRGWPRRPAEVS